MSFLRGGKTSQRLLQDLNIYNPDQLPTNGYNVLVELAFPYDEKTKPPKTTAKGSCKHHWALKPNACTSQVIDESEPALIVVGAFCTECRRHLSLEMDSRGEGPGVVPCPTLDDPLHHFCHNPKRSEGFRRTNGGLDFWEDTRLFQCSAQACSTRLTVRMRSPRLKRGFTDLLLDRKLIEERARKAMALDPERFEGHAVPPPLTVMSNLRAYLSNAMRGEVKHIQKNNKKWLLSLGEPCEELLSYLQFSFEEDLGWDPPRPDVTDTAPFSTDLKVLLDDVDNELQVLMSKQPDEEKRQLKLHFSFTPATKEIQSLLGCDDYKRSLASRTANESEDDEHPFYGGLGAVLDFHDSLIEFAYSRQNSCDPKNNSYYLQCLQGIAEGRNSEELRLKVVMEASTGKISIGQIQEAYAAFGLDMHSLYLDDEHIIGNFRSRISDAPRQEDDLRQALTIIGQHRNSSKIEHYATDTITTYEQALSWLGATADMDDSFIVTMHGVKVSENETNDKTARDCVEMIARTRNSMALRSWLLTGDLVQTDMDVGQAYARLDIGVRTVDDDLVLSAYNSALQDQPSQETELKSALIAIAKDRNSTTLKNYANVSAATDHKLSEWPVGLDNIGNTCYLNSLLQFYFTIKPLRELVLNFDDYKVDFETSAFEKKQVGSRNVSKREVERAQTFVLELQKLFNSMISANATDVKPEIELARLTLLSSSAEDTYRRRSTLKTQRPSLGEIEGKPVHGPQPPPVISEDTARERQDSVTVMGDDAQTVQTPISIMAGEEDRAGSDSTLFEKPSPMTLDLQEVDQQAKALENKENMAPRKQETGRPITPPESPLKPLADAAPSRINEQGTNTSDQNVSKDETMLSPTKSDSIQSLPPPPTRSAPPVPPRNKPLDRHEEIKKEVEFGAQQDVTEVISNVLFQLQCAIKPESIDESGEQIDRIKKLFFGKQKVTTTAKDGKARTKEEFFSDIKIQVSSGPRDIYAALDGAFDEQIVEVGTSKEPQFTSISLLPPILQLHVSRAQYNRVSKEFFKATHHLEIKETIFMDRYIDSDDADLQKRRAECWAWKKELGQLERREAYLRKTELEISMPEALEQTVTYLKQLLEDKDSPEAIEVPEDLPQKIAEAAKKTKEELSDLESRIKDLTTNINSQFTDLRTLPYHLHSVIIHRGVVSSGHYWIYIYDFMRKIWRQYNDDRVEEVADLTKIYQRDTDQHRPATSSFLVYVKEGLELDLTEAVCRQIDEEVVAGSSADVPIQIDGASDVQMLEGRSDSPMAKLSRWATDLQPHHHQEDVEMKDASNDAPVKLGAKEKFKELMRPSQILGHKNITW